MQRNTEFSLPLSFICKGMLSGASVRLLPRLALDLVRLVVTPNGRDAPYM